MKNILNGFLLIAVLTSCNQEPTQVVKKIDFDGIDESIKPGDNFFSHVNNNWYEAAQIADDQVGVGAYRYLNIPQKVLLEDILEELSSEAHQDGSLAQKVGDFYASGMDTVSINARGFTPIQSTLHTIDAIETVPQLMGFIADEMTVNHTSIMAFGVSPDNENSRVNMLHFGQTGLGLPDRAYYFKTDSSTLAIQEAYRTLLSKVFELTNDEDGVAHAAVVYAIEKQLAESHKTRVERRNVKANYNKLAVTELDMIHPNIGWTTLLDKLGLDADSIDIRQPAYFDQLNRMLSAVSIADWKRYLKASTLTTYASVLSQSFEEAAFNYSKVLSGQTVEKTRAQLMVQQVDRQIGFALAQLYVKRHFNEAAKKRALELVNNLQKAFENRINQLDWMSDSTKVKAKEKLYAITKKIGYPDVWRSYDQVNIESDKYFENVLALRQDNFQYRVDKLGKAPNKEEWHTTPPTVTAYYNPSANEIVFPAGILQFPYFDLQADDALNYGGIGMVIGHEFTHAFDDQGAQFDKEGNVKNWWTAEDYDKFKTKTNQIIDQYSAFTVLDSVHLKGALTVGENTADNGGLAIAYDAFKMTQQGQDTAKIDGYTPDQRFFLSVARIWRVKTRDAFMRNYVTTDPHSPAMWRVNGPLMNFTPFYEAFDLRAGEKNYKSEEARIKIW
jgi:putative endopeptidase